MSATTSNTSRTRKSTVNLLTGLFSQLIILVLNFAIRYLFVKKIGVEYLGINSLFSNILTVLSVADLGFGSALGIVLYSSLAHKNEDEIAGLMQFFKRVYLTIGIIVTLVGLAITPFVKYLVNTEADIPHLALYFLLFLLNTVSSYFISYRAILIRADQKNSVVNNVTTIVKISKAVLETLVLLILPNLVGLTATYVSYLVVMVLSTYAIGIITSIYAKKKYAYAFNPKAVVDENKKKEIVSTTKGLLVYRLCAAFSSPIDSIIISVFVGTAILGIYSNYLLIFTTLMEFICLISRNVISSVGNFVVERPIEDQKKLYFEMQIIYFAIIVFCVINFVSLATPFITIMFDEENVLSKWVVFLLGFTLFCRCAGELAIIFRETTSIYKKTKFISLFQTFIHIGLSLALGKMMGLEGILLGYVIAYLCTNFWFEIYALFKWYFKSNPIRPLLEFLYIAIVAFGISFGGYYLCNMIANKGGFVFFALTILTSLAISIVSLISLYPIDGFSSLFNRIKKMTKSAMKAIPILHNTKKIQLLVMITYVVSLTLSILLRDILGLNINKYIYLALVVIATLLSNKRNAIAILFFTLPISPSLAELYILVYALAYIFVISLRNKKNVNLARLAIIFSIPGVILILEIILSSIYGSVQWTSALRTFVLLSILAFIFYDRELFTKQHLYSILYGFLYLLIVVGINWWFPALYGVTHKAPGSTWLSLSVLLREVRLGFSMIDWITLYASVEYPFAPPAMVGENPNNIGLICIISLSLVFVLYGTERGKKKAKLLLFALLFTVFGAWSQSRTFLLTSVLLLLFFVFLPFVSKRTSLINTLLLFSFFIFIVATLLLSVPGLMQTILKRFSEKDASTGGGRITLIGDYFSFIFSDWKYALFGVSCANLQPLSRIEIVPHANFMQFIGSYGLLSFICFIAFIVIAFKKTKVLVFRSSDLYLLLPLTMTSIFTMTLQLFAPSIILIAFIPGVLCLSFLNKNNSNEKVLKYYPCMPIPVFPEESIKMAICSTSFGGGIGSYIGNISSCLSEDSFELSFVYNPDTNKSEKTRFAGINKKEYAYSDKKSSFKPLKLIRKFKYYLKSFNDFSPSVIYINTSSYSRSFILLMAAYRYKCAQIIIHCHNAVNNKTKLSFGERIVRWFVSFGAYKKFACSKEAAKVFFGKDFDNQKNRGEIVTNFIDTDIFKYSKKDRQKIRKELKIKPSEIVFGSVGRLSEEKNQKFIIDLVSLMPSTYKTVVVGSGPLEKSLKFHAFEENLTERIIFIKNTPEVYKFYSAFDYFLLPSQIEGLPFVAVEAQCSGLRTLANESLPHALAVTDKVAFLPLDLEKWQQYILNNDPFDELTRLKAYEDIHSAHFSKETAPSIIIDKIKKVAYGQ